jgi:hypothetical protein
MQEILKSGDYKVLIEILINIEDTNEKSFKNQIIAQVLDDFQKDKLNIEYFKFK